MTSSSSTGTRRRPFERAGRKLDSTFEDVGQKLEREAERAIAYLNDEVVPAVRKGSTRAMRVAARKLTELADFMERQKAEKP